MDSHMEQPVSRGGKSELIPEVLKAFFARARNIVGSEETYRAILVHQLRNVGIHCDDIVAEYPTGSGRIDLAILSRDQPGESIAHLIEIKGGAYGNRHALHDELKAGLEKKDLKKLKETGDVNTKRWFIALDLSSIKGPIDLEARSWAASECTRRGINFVYYDFFSLFAQIISSGRQLVLSVEDQPTNYRMDPEAASVMDSDLFWEKSSKACQSKVLHEQNMVLRIYEALMSHRLPDYAVSLETQFQFAKGRSKNGKNRPDICIFDPTINGKFNLYAQGRIAQSRDALKLSKLQRLIEVKVAPTIGDALDDIKKLAGWRAQMQSRANDLGVEMHDQVGFMFVAAHVDSRIQPEIIDYARDLGISTRIL